METPIEKTERVKRLLKWINDNPSEPWHLPRNKAWKDAVIKDALELGLINAPKAYVAGPDWEGMILDRQERQCADWM